MQLDLQLPLQIDSILLNKVSLHFTKDGNVAWVDMPKFKANSVHQINIFYHGRPHEASNPPGMVAGFGKRTNQVIHG